MRNLATARQQEIYIITLQTAPFQKTLSSV